MRSSIQYRSNAMGRGYCTQRRQYTTPDSTRTISTRCARVTLGTSAKYLFARSLCFLQTAGCVSVSHLHILDKTLNAHQALYPTSNVAAEFEESDTPIAHRPKKLPSKNAPPAATRLDTLPSGSSRRPLAHDTAKSSAPNTARFCDQYKG